MFIFLFLRLILLSQATVASSISSSSPVNASLSFEVSSSWRNTTATASTHPSTMLPQLGSVTGPAFHVITQIYSTTWARTLRSGASETVTVPGGKIEVEYGPKMVTELDVETISQPNLYTNTQNKTYQPWDPSQFSGLFSVPEEMRTSHDPSILASWTSFTNYAREPTCTKDFSNFIATQPITSIITLVEEPYKDPINSLEWDNSYVYSREIQTNSWATHCCGNCEFVYASVQLFYWPVQHPNTACYATMSPAANSTSVSDKSIVRVRDEDHTVTSAPQELVYATDEDGFT